MGYPWSNPIRRGEAILATDITELRDEIKQQGNLAGLNPPITWNPATISQGDRILASHFREMRAAIQRLWNSKNRGPLPMWSSGTRPGGPSEGVPSTSILATDVTDLRRWLDVYIDNHPRLGMDTKSYDAAARNRPVTDTSGGDSNHGPWVPDIAALMPAAPGHFMVRCIVNSPVEWEDESGPNDNRWNIPWNNSDRSNYRDTFQLIRESTGSIVYALLAPSFNSIASSTAAINQPLDL